MPDQASIFGNENQATQPNQNGGVPPVAQNGDLANLLGSIKNERGEQKYKSVEDALVGLKNAQEHIPTLNSQLAQREVELAEARKQAARVEELQRTVEALAAKNDGDVHQPIQSLSADQVAELVNQTLTKQQQAASAQSNIATVVNALQAKFGAEAEKAYNAKAQEIGMTVLELNTLAAKNPKAVFTLLGVSQEAPKQMSSSSPTPSFNTDGFQPKADSFIGRNTKATLIGATTTDLQEESLRARQMVEELHSQGKSISDLTNPKVYFKTFK